MLEKAVFLYELKMLEKKKCLKRHYPIIRDGYGWFLEEN
jgi:hypothetical protein